MPIFSGPDPYGGGEGGGLPNTLTVNLLMLTRYIFVHSAKYLRCAKLYSIRLIIHVRGFRLEQERYADVTDAHLGIFGSN